MTARLAVQADCQSADPTNLAHRWGPAAVDSPAHRRICRVTARISWVMPGAGVRKRPCYHPRACEDRRCSFSLPAPWPRSSAQGPAGIDWNAADAETLKHFQAIVQIDSTDPPTTPPGVEKPVVDYLRAVLEKEGIPTADLRRRGEPAQPRRPAQGQREEAAAPADGAHRHGEHRRREVDPPALQRPPPGRLHLRPRHRRRQGQRRRHGHGAADAEAPERAPRPRRDRALRGRRGRRGALRHPVHGRPAPGRDRVGVLPGRRRQPQPPGRQGDLRLDPDAREDSPRHHPDRAGHGRPRLGAAALERGREAHHGGLGGGQVEAADRLQRDDRRLLQAPGEHLGPGGGGPLPRHPRQRSQGPGRRRRVLPRQRAAPRLDHPHLDFADDDPGRLPHQRHPVGSEGHARRRA